MELFLRPEAVADLRATRAYYEGVAAGLGRGFVASLDELFVRLRAFPRSAPPVAGYEDVRRAVVRGFPFVVFYRLRPDRIDILRVLHAARSDADPPPGVGSS